MADCYVTGTNIATPAGEVAVEDLEIGDLIVTVLGIAKPVKWIWRRSHPAAAVAKSISMRPVMIHEAALGVDLPRRDLVVSPMHALLIDGLFVPAVALVNGVSIVRDDTVRAVNYIHVQLDQHEAIFAEGVAAETFVDDGNCAQFDNVSEYYSLYGVLERQSRYLAPRIEDGYELDGIRRRLHGVSQCGVAPGMLAGHVERLAQGNLHGWVMDQANPTTPVELEVLLDGEIVTTVLANRYRADLDDANLAGGCCGFIVAMPASAKDLTQLDVRRASDSRQVALPEWVGRRRLGLTN